MILSILLTEATPYESVTSQVCESHVTHTIRESLQLQCVAVCCSVLQLQLQCVAVAVAVRCSVLQLQCVVGAVCCSVLLRLVVMSLILWRSHGTHMNGHVTTYGLERNILLQRQQIE